MTKFAIFYHNPCHDGMAAYTILAMALAGNDVIGIPCTYPSKINKGNPYDVSDRYVIMVDYSMPPEDLMQLQTKSLGVLVIDHHKTAKDNLKHFKVLRDMDYHSLLDEMSANTVVWFDMAKSGGQLALEFAKKYLGFGYTESMQMAIDQLADYDLWTHDLPDTKAIIEGMSVMVPDYDLSLWKLFITNYAQNKERIAVVGDILLAKHKLVVSGLLSDAFMITIDDVQYPACNAQYQYRNDVGNELSKIYGVPAFVFGVQDGQVSCSIRSIGDDPEQDTTDLAGKWGGGGHFNASGCRMSLAEFTTLIG